MSLHFLKNTRCKSDFINHAPTHLKIELQKNYDSQLIKSNGVLLILILHSISRHDRKPVHFSR